MRDRLAEVGFSEVRADTIVATVSGDIDGSNAAELRRAVAERVPSTARSLIMDLVADDLHRLDGRRAVCSSWRAGSRLAVSSSPS